MDDYFYALPEVGTSDESGDSLFVPSFYVSGDDESFPSPALFAGRPTGTQPQEDGLAIGQASQLEPSSLLRQEVAELAEEDVVAPCELQNCDACGCAHAPFLCVCERSTCPFTYTHRCETYCTPCIFCHDLVDPRPDAPFCCVEAAFYEHSQMRLGSDRYWALQNRLRSAVPLTREERTELEIALLTIGWDPRHSDLFFSNEAWIAAKGELTGAALSTMTAAATSRWNPFGDLPVEELDTFFEGGEVPPVVTAGHIQDMAHAVTNLSTEDRSVARAVFFVEYPECRRIAADMGKMRKFKCLLGLGLNPKFCIELIRFDEMQAPVTFPSKSIRAQRHRVAAVRAFTRVEKAILHRWETLHDPSFPSRSVIDHHVGGVKNVISRMKKMIMAGDVLPEDAIVTANELLQIHPDTESLYSQGFTDDWIFGPLKSMFRDALRDFVEDGELDTLFMLYASRFLNGLVLLVGLATRNKSLVFATLVQTVFLWYTVPDVASGVMKGVNYLLDNVEKIVGAMKDSNVLSRSERDQITCNNIVNSIAASNCSRDPKFRLVPTFTENPVERMVDADMHRWLVNHDFPEHLSVTEECLREFQRLYREFEDENPESQGFTDGVFDFGDSLRAALGFGDLTPAQTAKAKHYQLVASMRKYYKETANDVLWLAKCMFGSIVYAFTDSDPFDVEYNDLLRVMQALVLCMSTRKKVESLNEARNVIETYNLATACLALIARTRAAPPRQLASSFHTAYSVYRPFYLEAEQYVRSGEPMPKPVWVHFHGESSLGKTNAITNLCTSLHGVWHPTEEWDESKKFSTNAGSRYKDGYKNQEFFIIDELFTTENPERREEDTQLLLTIVNSFAAPLETAFGDKHSTHCRARVIFSSSNMENLTGAILSTSDGTAIGNRCAFSVRPFRMTPVPPFKDRRFLITGGQYCFRNFIDEVCLSVNKLRHPHGVGQQFSSGIWPGDGSYEVDGETLAYLILAAYANNDKIHQRSIAEASAFKLDKRAADRLLRQPMVVPAFKTKNATTAGAQSLLENADGLQRLVAQQGDGDATPTSQGFNDESFGHVGARVRTLVDSDRKTFKEAHEFLVKSDMSLVDRMKEFVSDHKVYVVLAASIFLVAAGGLAAHFSGYFAAGESTPTAQSYQGFKLRRAKRATKLSRLTAQSSFIQEEHLTAPWQPKTLFESNAKLTSDLYAVTKKATATLHIQNGPDKWANTRCVFVGERTIVACYHPMWDREPLCFVIEDNDGGKYKFSSGHKMLIDKKGDLLVIRLPNSRRANRTITKHLFDEYIPEERAGAFLARVSYNADLNGWKLTTGKARGFNKPYYTITDRPGEQINMNQVSHVTFNATGEPGDCGNLVWDGHKLVGMHVAGAPGSSVAVVLTRKDVDCWLEQLNDTPEVDFEEATESSQAMAAVGLSRDIDHSVKFRCDAHEVGSMKGMHLMKATKLYRSPLGEALPEPTTCPSTKTAETIQANYDKIREPLSEEPPADIWRHWAEVKEEILELYPRDENVRKLTTFEAINGVDGLGGIPMNTSKGLPNIHAPSECLLDKTAPRTSKYSEMSRDDEEVVLSDNLEAGLKYVRKCLYEGRRPFVVCGSQVKDETKTIKYWVSAEGEHFAEKPDVPARPVSKCRVFYPGSDIMTIIDREFFGLLYQRLRSVHNTHPFKIGIDPHSEWETLYHWLREGGDTAVFYDAERWDMSQLPGTRDKLYEIYEEWLGHWEEDDRKAALLWLKTKGELHFTIEDRLYRFNGEVASGEGGTGDNNCALHLILALTAMKNYNDTAKVPVDTRKARVALFGDDSATAARIRDLPLYAEKLGELGLVVKDPFAKTGPPVLLPIEEGIFLQRKLGPIPLLAMDSLYSMLQWTRGSSRMAASDTALEAQHIASFAAELAYYGEDVYNEHREKLENSDYWKYKEHKMPRYTDACHADFTMIRPWDTHGCVLVSQSGPETRNPLFTSAIPQERNTFGYVDVADQDPAVEIAEAKEEWDFLSEAPYEHSEIPAIMEFPVTFVHSLTSSLAFGGVLARTDLLDSWHQDQRIASILAWFESIQYKQCEVQVRTRVPAGTAGVISIVGASMAKGIDSGRLVGRQWDCNPNSAKIDLSKASVTEMTIPYTYPQRYIKIDDIAGQDIVVLAVGGLFPTFSSNAPTAPAIPVWVVVTFRDVKLMGQYSIPRALKGSTPVLHPSNLSARHQVNIMQRSFSRVMDAMRGGSASALRAAVRNAEADMFLDMFTHSHDSTDGEDYEEIQTSQGFGDEVKKLLETVPGVKETEALLPGATSAPTIAPEIPDQEQIEGTADKMKMAAQFAPLLADNPRQEAMHTTMTQDMGYAAFKQYVSGAARPRETMYTRPGVGLDQTNRFPGIASDLPLDILAARKATLLPITLNTTADFFKMPAHPAFVQKEADGSARYSFAQLFCQCFDGVRGDFEVEVHVVAGTFESLQIVMAYVPKAYNDVTVADLTDYQKLASVTHQISAGSEIITRTVPIASAEAVAPTYRNVQSKLLSEYHGTIMVGMVTDPASLPGVTPAVRLLVSFSMKNSLWFRPNASRLTTIAPTLLAAARAMGYNASRKQAANNGRYDDEPTPTSQGNVSSKSFSTRTIPAAVYLESVVKSSEDVQAAARKYCAEKIEERYGYFSTRPHDVWGIVAFISGCLGQRHCLTDWFEKNWKQRSVAVARVLLVGVVSGLVTRESMYRITLQCGPLVCGDYKFVNPGYQIGASDFEDGTFIERLKEFVEVTKDVDDHIEVGVFELVEEDEPKFLQALEAASTELTDGVVEFFDVGKTDFIVRDKRIEGVKSAAVHIPRMAQQTDMDYEVQTQLDDVVDLCDQLNKIAEQDGVIHMWKVFDATVWPSAVVEDLVEKQLISIWKKAYAEEEELVSQSAKETSGGPDDTGPARTVNTAVPSALPDIKVDYMTGLKSVSDPRGQAFGSINEQSMGMLAQMFVPFDTSLVSYSNDGYDNYTSQTQNMVFLFDKFRGLNNPHRMMRNATPGPGLPMVPGYPPQWVQEIGSWDSLAQMCSRGVKGGYQINIHVNRAVSTATNGNPCLYVRYLTNYDSLATGTNLATQLTNRRMTPSFMVPIASGDTTGTQRVTLSVPYQEFDYYMTPWADYPFTHPPLTGIIVTIPKVATVPDPEVLLSVEFAADTDRQFLGLVPPPPLWNLDEIP